MNLASFEDSNGPSFFYFSRLLVRNKELIGVEMAKYSVNKSISQ